MALSTAPPRPCEGGCCGQSPKQRRTQMSQIQFKKYYNFIGQLSGYHAYQNHKQIARIEKKELVIGVVAGRIQSTKLVISQKFKTLKDAKQRVIKNAEWSERKSNDTNT